MSASFVAQLRTTRSAIVIADGAGAITFRVAAPDLWETVRLTASPSTIVSDVRKRVVSALFPPGERDDDFVLKLKGWEVLDTRATLAEVGVVDGAILLLAYRRRRPVR